MQKESLPSSVMEIAEMCLQELEIIGQLRESRIKQIEELAKLQTNDDHRTPEYDAAQNGHPGVGNRRGEGR